MGVKNHLVFRVFFGRVSLAGQPWPSSFIWQNGECQALNSGHRWRKGFSGPAWSFFWQDLLCWGRASWARPPHRGRARAGGGRRAATVVGCGGGNSANSRTTQGQPWRGQPLRGRPWRGQPWHGQPWKGQGEAFFCIKNTLFFLYIYIYIQICIRVNLGGGNPGGALAGATTNGKPWQLIENLDRALQASGAHMALEALLGN